MTMRLKPSYTNHIKDWFKGITILYIVILGIFLLTSIFVQIQVMTSLDDGNANINGLEFISQIFVFVSGIVMFKQQLKLSLANGISRKTEFTATYLSAATISLLLFVLNIIVNFIFSLIIGYEGMFEDIFSNYIFVNQGIKLLTKFIFDILSIMTYFVAGYFIGALYYRMNKTLKVIVSVGVPVIIFVGFPIVLDLYGKSGPIAKLIVGLAKFTEMIAQNPYFTIIANLIFAVVISVCTFLLIRKAPIKEQM